MQYSFNKFVILENNFGLLFFNFGIIFLPSAAPVGGLFLLTSLTIAIIKRRTFFFKDKWNLPLFVATGLILISCIKNTISPSIPTSSEWNSSYIWLQLFNWIPLFLCFWGFQTYLQNYNQRKLFAKSLIIGTFPVIISCITQYWFQWFGPFEFFNNLIVWFQKPITTDQGVTGLFSNQNYAGFWLSTVFPFSLVLVLIRNKLNIKFLVTSLLSFAIFYLAILTNSRNAFIGIISSIPILLSFKYLLFIFLLIIIIYPFSIYLLPLLSETLAQNIQSLIPVKLIHKITRFDINNILNYPRTEIYLKSLNMIYLKPFLGWGASTFSIVYLIQKGVWNAQHSHNLSLQLAYDFGIPVSLVLTIMVFLIFIKSWGKIINQPHNKNNLIDRAWISSAMIAIFFHLNDIPYYDVKVSILIWTLLSGLKCILDEKEFIKE